MVSGHDRIVVRIVTDRRKHMADCRFRLLNKITDLIRLGGGSPRTVRSSRETGCSE